MYEVLDASINLHLNDEDAIRGVERLRNTIKRNVKAMGRERAIINIEGNIRNFKRSLKEAEALAEKSEAKIAKLEERRLTTKDKAEKISLTKQIKAERELQSARDKEAKSVKEVLDKERERLTVAKELHKHANLTTKEIKELERAQDSLAKTQEAADKKHAKAQEDERKRSIEILRAEREMNAVFTKRGEEYMKAEKEHAAAIEKNGRAQRKQFLDEKKASDMMESSFIKRGEAEIKARRESLALAAKEQKLQQEFNKAREAARRIEEKRGKFSGKVREAANPAIQQSVELNYKRALAEMEIARQELTLMGKKPVEINTKLHEKGNLVSKLAGIGDVGTRIGPFAGTLSQFGKAMLALGPIVTGLVGYIGALTGAVGAGLTGALGLAGGAALSFGLSLGGVGLLTASLMRDFKGLNTLQKAYHTQVLKTGEGSDKAKTKLAEFNHALGAVTPTTREAFLHLDKLQDKWRGLRQAAKPDFLNALGSTFTTLNADFAVFSKRTLSAFHLVSAGWQEWMAALRSDQGREVIGSLMNNANRAIPPLMHGLGSLVAAIAKVGVSFSRHLKPMFERFDTWATHLNSSSNATSNLDQGVNRLVKSFYGVWHVLTGAGRVLKEFMLTAMGPGGKAVDNLAGGLNHIADSIRGDRAGDNKLGKFLDDSVGTVDKLYHAILPLMKLFIEFSTIMRPFTDSLLSILGPATSVLHTFLGFGPVKTALQGWAAIWLFRKGTVGILSNIATALQLVASAAKAIGAAKVAGTLAKWGAGLGASKLAGGAATKNPVGFGPPAEGGLLSKGLSKIGGGSILKGLGRTGVIGAATFVGVEWAKGITEGFKTHDWGRALTDVRSKITFGLFPKGKDYTAIDKNITDDIDRIEMLAQQRAAAKEIGIKLNVDFKTDKANEAFVGLEHQIGRTAAGAAGSIRAAKTDLEMNMKAIAHTMDINSTDGKIQVAANFRAVAASIKHGIDNGAIDTKKGMEQIHSYLVQALTTLGLTKSGANLYLKHRDPLTGSKQGGKYTPKAVGGFIGMPGEAGRDEIPLMVGRGEAVLNRHQQKYVNAGLQTLGIDGLPGLFQMESTPHYMMNSGGIAKAAQGRIPRYMTNAGGQFASVTQGNLDKYREAAQRKLSDAEAAAAEQDSVGSTTGLTDRVKRAISWARHHGWHGQVTSGFRSYAEQAVLYQRYLHGGNIAAKPGQSNHESGRAIDVTDHEGFNRAMQTAPANAKLKWFGPGDSVHFSVDGRAQGGIVGAARGFLNAAKGKSPLSKILSKVFGRAPGLQSFNHQYKKGSREQLDPMVIRAIGEAVGMSPTEALHAMQISKGESTRMPGAVSKDGGFGLMQNTPRVWGAKAKKYMAQLGGQSALMNPIISMAMGKYLMDDRKKQGKDPLGPWFGTKYLNRASKAKGSVLPQFQTRGTSKSINAPRLHGRTMDMDNLLAIDESNLGRAGRTSNGYDDVWAGAVLGDRLTQQNKQSRTRIGVIDKRLKGRLTKDDRTSLLSERSGLVSGIESNRARVKEVRTTARDQLFEAKRGKGKNKIAVDYNKALAEGTDTLDDDVKASQAEADYYQSRIDFLKKNHGTKEQITEAINNYNSATKNTKSLQDQIKSDQEAAAQTFLSGVAGAAGLTTTLDDDLQAAQMAEKYYSEQYELAKSAGDMEGIGKWSGELKSARDNIKSIKEQIDLSPLQTNTMMASLTNDLNDDATAAAAMVDYYQGIYDTATGADKITAGGNLAGARGDLASAKRNAELLPLERDQALAALTTTLDDDQAATVKLRDYWAGQLDNAKASGDIPGQIEAAGNLKGLNDQIGEAQKSVTENMIILSEARRDLYKAFANNFVSQIPAGTLAPQTPATYAGSGQTIVNQTNNFQAPPDDPHTWTAGVAWELQAAV